VVLLARAVGCDASPESRTLERVVARHTVTRTSCVEPVLEIQGAWLCSHVDCHYSSVAHTTTFKQPLHRNSYSILTWIFELFNKRLRHVFEEIGQTRGRRHELMSPTGKGEGEEIKITHEVLPTRNLALQPLLGPKKETRNKDHVPTVQLAPSRLKTLLLFRNFLRSKSDAKDR